MTKPHTKKQQLAVARNFKIFRLRGLYVSLHNLGLTADEDAFIREVFNQRLTALEANTIEQHITRNLDESITEGFKTMQEIEQTYQLENNND